MTTRISERLRKEVSLRAGFKCEYCLIPEFFLATTFHIDHIRSQKHGGKTTIENLAYTCPHCNQNKGSDVATFIGESEQLIRFFNPRTDTWYDHFQLINGEIVGVTEIGKATVIILHFNQTERVILRANLIEIGMYPAP
ncbi:HNH endonuclease [Runella limosa]|uniref:HNH endonuclease n=1 Tax=Runella limosa TaxID=370978 RepID=UPI0005697108|nr:HNH endonuclease signature motif containing protein [Runella limosa]